MSKQIRIASIFSKKRTYIHIALGIITYYLISYFHISLWWVVGVGSATGIIFGKIFCRWVCPLGIMMEFMMKMNPNDSLKNMYQYHKLGCPIAWISGLLNKISLFKIKLNHNTCKSCGACDKACYMPTIDSERFSLYKKDKTNPATAYSCSKCLKCVSACPNGSLTFKVDTLAIETYTNKNKITQ